MSHPKLQTELNKYLFEPYNKKVKEQIEDIIVDYLYTFCDYEDSMFADKPFNPVVTNVHYKINYDEKLRNLSIELS